MVGAIPAFQLFCPVLIGNSVSSDPFTIRVLGDISQHTSFLGLVSQQTDPHLNSQVYSKGFSSSSDHMSSFPSCEYRCTGMICDKCSLKCSVDLCNTSLKQPPLSKSYLWHEGDLQWTNASEIKFGYHNSPIKCCRHNS